MIQNISLRLKTIASLVPFGARVCDIGTDHGYLAINLINTGKAEYVIAADINPLPLKNAQKNIEKSGIKGIELRLTDGLDGIKSNEADTIIIAGIGGEVIWGILERGLSIASDNKLIILQPTTSPEYLRKQLYNNGFEIQSEVPVFENGKVYSVMVCKYSGKSNTKEEYFYYTGFVLPDTESGKLYLEKQFKRCKSCAESLKNIPLKQEEYLYYSKVSAGIENYLKSHLSEND